MIRAGWSWVHARAEALKPCRVPLLMVLAGLAFLLLASQGEDVARALAERRSGDSSAVWHTRWFFAATLAWSLSAWYWARVMLFLKLPGVPPEQDPRLQPLRTWTPRLLGFAAALGVSTAFYRAAGGYASGEQQAVQELLRFYGLWSALGAFVFLFAVSLRRPAARYAYRKLREGSRLQSALAPVLNLPASREQAYGGLSLHELSRLTRGLLGAAIAAFALLFILLTAVPHWAAPAMGTAAIVLLAAAGWTAIAATLDFIGMRSRVPVFSALLVLAVVFSLWNDNHEVRTLEARQPTSRPDLRANLNVWLARHAAKLKDPKARIPLYVVDAEGGGIRAAYWTVTVLGEIQKRHPEFAEHLFSLSGVSGGSLGSAVFVALLAQSRDDKAFDIKQTAQAILSEDFLSPVVASLLYPDLVQRFLPLPVASFDRARTLEESWENAWNKHVPKRARMSEPLERLWENRDDWTPALLLNATWVETGKRLIASNLNIAATKEVEDFVDTEDANAFFAPRSLSLATAAHMSARFTYVSPAGTLVRQGRAHGRVVDGGYFENSGATASYEILQTIELMKDGDARWAQVEPYVIHVSNDPVEAKYGDDSLASAPDNPRIAPRQLLNEALSPLYALLNTRDARGYHSRESVMWLAGRSHSFHFGLCRSSANVPLGWVLSETTRSRMEAQLTQLKCGDVFDNPANLRAIDAQFAARPESAALLSGTPVKRNGGGGLGALGGLGTMGGGGGAGYGLGARIERPRNRTVTTYFATDRGIDPGAAPKKRYTNERGELGYGVARVNIPPGHKMGEIERPSWLRLEFGEDLQKHMVLVGAEALSARDYFARVNQAMDRKLRRAFVFVHGYNVTFEQAALRTAQMAVDLQIGAVPVFYSWPSQGTLGKYTVDEQNAEWTEGDLGRFLEAFAGRARADEIYVIAHSMGARAATRALASLLERRSDLQRRFRELVLAAPDIDAQVFREQIAPRFAHLRAPVTLYASSNDKALMASVKVHGLTRAGLAGREIVIAKGVETVDASNIDTDFLGHAYFVSARPLLTDLSLLINRKLPAAKRPTLDGMPTIEPAYWAFRK